MKIALLCLLPVILLSCHDPSSSKNQIETAPRASHDSARTGADDSSQAALTDTPSTPMEAKNWAGSWKNETMFRGGELKITGVTGGRFSFSIAVSDGGGSGELEGSATLKGYHAIYSNKDAGGPCKIEFTFEGDSIYMDQQQGNCEAGAGVYYSGYYYKHLPPKPAETLISLGMLDNESQDRKFRELVGDDYKLFVQSSQWVFEREHDEDSLGVMIHQAAIKHEFTESENIILINPHLDIWAAVINGDSVNYYTNNPEYKHRLPKTIDSWRENFKEKPIVFK
jgi:hypothetical protein